MKFTILGNSGFIGKNLTSYLKGMGYEVFTPSRTLDTIYGKQLGHVIYCIGLTGDFRSRPHDTIEAHVTLLSEVLRRANYDTFLYLSSTRVYSGLESDQLASEEEKLPLSPNSDSLYDLSKLLGEALCLSMRDPSVRIARLSNVYGPDMSKDIFLGSVLQDIKKNGKVTILDNPASAKDYISVEDVCYLLSEIVLHGNHSLYNVASGASVRCEEIADWLKKEGHVVTFANKNQPRIFPEIDVSRIKEEFDFEPKLLKDEIKQLIT